MQRHKMKKAMLILLFILLTIPSKGQSPYYSISDSPCRLAFFSPASGSGKKVPYLSVWSWSYSNSRVLEEEFGAEDIVVWVTFGEPIEPDTVTDIKNTDAETPGFYELEYFDEELNVPGRGVHVEWLHEEHPFHFVYFPSRFQEEFVLGYSCLQPEDLSP